MLGFGVLLLGLVAGPGTVAERPRVTPDAFRAWFDASREGNLEFPAAAEKAVQGYQYVFIGGFASERMSSYFLQNAQDLQTHGVPQRSIHFIFPSSEGTIDENSGLVNDTFRKIARESPGKLVVIAHSRGACDALTFALRHPEFVADRIEAMFLVQGPFGGSGLADVVAGDGPAPDRQMRPQHRATATILARLERYYLGRGHHAGLPELATDAAHDYWKTLLREHHEAIAVVGPRTFYVTAATAPGHQRMFQRSAAYYLDTYFGTNDGVVALDDQSLPEVGTVLAVLDARHTDLTHRSPLARAQRRLRRALVEGILMAVGNNAAIEDHTGSKAR